MQILSINLSNYLSDVITCDLGDIVCRVKNIEEACELIRHEDFSVIINALELNNFDRQALSRLLGLTPISTRMLLIGDTEHLENCEDLSAQGVEFINNPTGGELVRSIQTSRHQPN